MNVGSAAINNVAGRNILIGKANTGGQSNASFDDLYLYNRALSEEEIRYLYLDKPELMVNNYLYNGSSEYNSTAQWYETMFRGYDPVLGRMNGVDVMADKYGSMTPYNFAFNSPVIFNDPSGMDPTIPPIDDHQIFDNGTAGGSGFAVTNPGFFSASQWAAMGVGSIACGMLQGQMARQHQLVLHR